MIISSSDGTAPHFVNVKMMDLTKIEEILLFLNYEKDDSYTPNRIVIKSGLCEFDTQLVLEQDIVKPKGWISFIMSPSVPPATFLQVSFPYNYLNGKDLRLRGLQIRGYKYTIKQISSSSSTSNTSTKYKKIKNFDFR